MGSGFGQGFSSGDFGFLGGGVAGFSGPVGSPVPVPQVVVGTPVLSPALEGDNLSLSPATLSPPSPVPTQTFTLYVNASPVVGYTNVSLATLLGYVWQASDEWLNAYVEQTISSPNLAGSPVTLTSNTVNVDGLDNFILLIKTDAGTSPANPPQWAQNILPETGTTQFRSYIMPGGTYDIDWGDGTIQNGVTGIQTRTYASAGTYQIRIRNLTGAVRSWDSVTPVPFANVSDSVKILELRRWGTTAWTSCLNMFGRARRVVGTYYDAPNLSLCSSCQGMFDNAVLFNASPNAPPPSTWDVSAVTNMSSMFGTCAFNQPIGNWNVSNVTNMSGMFGGALAFNQPIGNWNVSNVTNMSGMFNFNLVFNQPIGNWNVSNVTNMSSMFRLGIFNQPIGNWDVSKVTTMLAMFANNDFFNQPIGNWNVSAVTNMNQTFIGADSFNQDISGWNVASAIVMSNMFSNATAFNQNLGSWVLNNSVNLGSMLNNCGMSTENYSRTLIGWANERSATGNPNTRSLGATGRTYHNVNYGGTPYSDAVSARANLVAPTPGGGGWTISGDALVP